jgi:hypothetical protein
MCSALYCVIQIRIPSARLAARWYGDTHPMRITQSISLSNIQTLSVQSRRPALRRCETCQTRILTPWLACFLIGVTYSGKPAQMAAIRKQ